MSAETFVACSNCFTDEGLRLDAERLGATESSICPRCTTADGRKFTSDQLRTLAYHFFVLGTLHRVKYGAAPIVQFNDLRKTDIAMPKSLNTDVALLEDVLGIGFFFYGPREWMVGEIEPLKHLQKKKSRNEVIDRILREYGSKKLTEQDRFYRIRKGPAPHQTVANTTARRRNTPRAVSTRPKGRSCTHHRICRRAYTRVGSPPRTICSSPRSGRCAT